MSNKKRPLCVSTEAVSNQDKDNTKLRESQLKVQLMSLLEDGKRTRTELSRTLGIHDREVRRLVKDLRRSGSPICSSASESGYWIGSKEEIRHTIAAYRSRGCDCFETALAMEMTLENIDQYEMF